MPFEAVDYLTIDGYRYHFRNFKRFSIPVELPQLQAVRIQPPNIDAEVQSFEGGITANDLDATGNYYRDALGMEPVGPPNAETLPWLRVSKMMAELGATPAILGFMALRPYKNLLIAGGATDGQIYSYDGSSWELHDTLPFIPNVFVRWGSFLFAHSQSNANWSYSSAATNTWTDQTAALVGSACYGAVPVHYNTTEVDYIYRVVDDSSGFAAQLRRSSSNGPADTTEVMLAQLSEPVSRGGMVIDGNTLYLTGANIETDTPSGTVYSHSISTGGVGVAPVGQFGSNYAVQAALFRGKVYFGMQLRGELYVLDGGDLRLLRTFDTTYPVKAMTTANGALWVAVINTDLTRILIWRYDGETWSQPYYFNLGTLTPTGLNALTFYRERPVIGLANATAGVCALEVTSGTYNQTGFIEEPDVVYGAPGLKKGYLHGRLQHTALKAGQSIRLTHKLNGSTVETTDGTNADVGSVETIIPFPPETVGTRLRPKWYLNAASATGGSTNTITAYSAGVRATPLPPEREVWTADLALTNSVYNDGTTDTRDALEKYERLLELKRTGRMFQVVDPFRESSATSLPRAAMMAKIDAQVPLEWDAGQLASNQGGADIRVPIRISQALGDVVGPLNLDFENDAAGTSGANITGWAQSPTTSSGAASISTAQFKTGAKSIALTFSGTPTLYAETQTFTGLVGGRYYTVAGNIKRSLSAGMVYIEVSSTGLGVRTDELTSAMDADFDWYERTFQLPAANTALTLKLQGSSAGGAMPTGTVWFDSVRLME